MILYEIRENIRQKVQFDITEFTLSSGETIRFNSLDEFLFRAPLLKKLVYAYLKGMPDDGLMPLSYVANIFSEFNSVEYFSSGLHCDRMIHDTLYKKLVEKYIRNVHTWAGSMIYVQPYLFDAKYLLIGQYQKIADKCAWEWSNVQSMHYAGIHNHVRTLVGVKKHNDWFTTRMSIEKSFFSSIFRNLSFNPALVIKSYWKFIEVFDKNTQLTVQYIFSETRVDTRIIFPRNSKKYGRQDAPYLTMKLFARYQELFNLHIILSSKTIEISKYFTDLEQNKITHVDTWSRLHAATKQIVLDQLKKESGTYIENRQLSMYFVNVNSVERCTFTISNKSKHFRIYRHVNIAGHDDTLHHGSYLLGSKDCDMIATKLLDMGFMNIGYNSTEHLHNMSDYKLLSDSKSDAFSIQFLKLPQNEASKLFDSYADVQQLLSAEVEYALENNIEYKDTRQKKNYTSDMNTWFEWKQYTEDSAKYDAERKEKQQNKRQLIRNFIKKYKFE